MVYLIGAGAGDPSLITVRGLDLLRTADVVLYDRLADERLLFETKETCALIDVGKSAGGHTIPQPEITELLVEHGRTGGRVVRLKGGDPFLFGRGGEEAEALADAGIPFEVVPGVSALLAVTAYAGIPVTHRGFASTVGVATGHGAQGKTDDPVRWRELARAVDTVVVFMGVGSLEAITGELMAGGMSPETPAAVIERGATPVQRRITAPLASIAGRAGEESVSSPALFVCGPSVALADKLSWYRPGPLAGLTIGVTRPLRQSEGFTRQLGELGAFPVLMPTIRITHTPGRDDVRETMNRLDEYNVIVFLSTNGVEAFFEVLSAGGRDARALAGKTLAVIGPSTADALRGRGLSADVEAKSFIAEGLLKELLATREVAGKRVLLVRSNTGRETLREGLEQAGAKVDQAVFYETGYSKLRPVVREQVVGGAIDIITFTSSSTVNGFFSQVAPAELPGSVRLASIGPETSAAIRKYGYTPAIEAAEYTGAGLAEAILKSVMGTED